MKSIARLLCLLFCLLTMQAIAQSNAQIDEKKAKEQEDQVRKQNQQTVDKVFSDLKKNGRLNPDEIYKNYVNSLKGNKSTNPNLDLVKKQFDDLTKQNLPEDKLKLAVMDILNGDVFGKSKLSCTKEEDQCSSDLKCCEGLYCGQYTDPQDREKKVQYKCMKQVELNKTCTPQEGVCKIGVCGAYTSNSGPLNICGKTGNKCTKNDDCCSASCEGGLCVDAYRCQKCVQNGIPKNGEVCCDGYYEDENRKCIPDYPPIPLTYSPSPSIFQLVFNIIFPSAQANQVGTDIDPNASKYANFKTCTFESKKNYYHQMYNMDAPSNFPGETLGSLTKAAVDATHAFEFMAISTAVDDFWLTGGLSIRTRSKIAAEKIKAARLEAEAKFRELDDFMKCSCIEVKGLTHPEVTAAQKSWYTTSGICPNSAALTAKQAINKSIGIAEANLNQTNNSSANQAKINSIRSSLTALRDESSNNYQGVTSADDAGVGASGIKYNEMMVKYYAARVEIQAKLFTANAAPFADLQTIVDNLLAIQDYQGDDKGWKDSRTHINYNVYKGNVYKTVIEEIIDFVVKLATDAKDQKLSQTIGQIQTAFNNGIKYQFKKPKDVYRDVITDPVCWTNRYRRYITECVADVCVSVYKGSDYTTYCNETEVDPNALCGGYGPNSMCIKTAYKRTDNGKGNQNIYIIDPIYPTSYTVLNPNMNLWQTYQLRNLPGLLGYSPQNFTDAHYNNLKTLASQYAQTQDFHETQADQDTFATYAIEKHFMNPRVSNELAYPMPGLIPYYQDLVAKMALLTNVSIQTQGNDIQHFIDYANHYVQTTTQLAANTVKPTTHTINQIKNDIKLAEWTLGAVKMNSFTNTVSPVSGKPLKYLDGALMEGSFSAMNNLAGYKLKQKKKVDQWMKKVGGTARGKAMLAAQGREFASGVAGSGSANYMYASLDSKIKKTDDKTKAEAVKEELSNQSSEELDEDDDRSSGDGYAGRRRRSRGHDEELNNEIKDQKTLDQVLEETKDAKYNSDDTDSLWVKISKAYVRGAYPHLLQVQSDVVSKPKIQLSDEEENLFAPTKSKKRKIKSDAKDAVTN